MATYVIGDVQGCYQSLKYLLKNINWDPYKDRLIFLGDLVNRGPQSLDVLRFIKDAGACAEVVLGNHDIFMLALWLGVAPKNKKHNLQELLDSPDAQDLFAWLRGQPLIRYEKNNLYVHAGILPNLSIQECLNQAQKISNILVSDRAAGFLKKFFKHKINNYDLNFKEEEKLLFTLSYLTRMRMCISESELEFNFTGELSESPKNLFPWFRLDTKNNFKIFFGHWAALGYFNENNFYCLDSGCVWGGKLSCLRLEDEKLFQVNSQEK